MKSIGITLFYAFISTFMLAEGVVVKTTISLGRKSQNCDGFGICSTQVATENQLGAVNGSIILDAAGGTLRICINANDVRNIQADKVTYLYNKSTIEFLENFALPFPLTSALKATKPLIIKKGVYKLWQQNGEYHIEIPL